MDTARAKYVPCATVDARTARGSDKECTYGATRENGVELDDAEFRSVMLTPYD
jgi:hypothetical protein